MSEIFGPIYADAYDVLYHDKDYSAECDVVERIFQTYGDGSIHSVLDLGCGTGNHAIPLAQRGYAVVGVDRSESMLARARRKAAGLTGDRSAVFRQGDIRNIKLQEQFDAVLLMFAVLGYQLGNADVLAVFRVAHQHLRPGGLLMLDVWYGPAVLAKRLSDRIKIISLDDGKILRVASGELNVRKHLCTVRYRLWRLHDSILVGETQEEHQMRYFFPRELEFFLEVAGFKSVRLGAFPNFDQEPDESTWNVIAVATAI